MSVKKRKVTPADLERYKKSVGRVACWAEHILARLDDGLHRLDLVHQQLLYEETEAEVKGQEENVDDVTKEGENLISGECSSSRLISVGREACHLVSLNKHCQC